MKKVLLLILLIIISINLFAQKRNNFDKRNYDKRNYFTYGVSSFVDAIVVPIDKNDSAEVNVVFKILYDALSFTQVNPLENPEPFRAIAEVEIVISDDQGIIRGRLPWKDTLFVKNNEITNSKDLYLEGTVNKRLAPGNYKISFDLIDKIKQNDDKKEFDIKIPNKTNAIYKATFGEIINKDGKLLFKPFIWDNKVNFSSKNIDVICIKENENTNDKYFYSIKKIESKSLDYKGDSVDYTAEANLMFNKNIEFNTDSRMWEIITIPNSNKVLVNFKLPAQDLTPGTYNLTVFNESNTSKLETKFEVEWIDIPVSLLDFDYSYKILYYLLTDDEFDNLSSGSDNEIKKKMSEFWQKKDPTIGTPFNEAIEQYYKRVDYSFFNFQSIKERDGARTARGKIYILFGKPDEIFNQFVDGKSQEIWTYSRLNKKFFFEIRDKGVFELILIEG